MLNYKNRFFKSLEFRVLGTYVVNWIVNIVYLSEEWIVNCDGFSVGFLGSLYDDKYWDSGAANCAIVMLVP